MTSRTNFGAASARTQTTILEEVGNEAAEKPGSRPVSRRPGPAAEPDARR